MWSLCPSRAVSDLILSLPLEQDLQSAPSSYKLSFCFVLFLQLVAKVPDYTHSFPKINIFLHSKLIKFGLEQVH